MQKNDFFNIGINHSHIFHTTIKKSKVKIWPSCYKTKVGRNRQTSSPHSRIIPYFLITYGYPIL